MDTTEALRLADSILTIEPENSMVIEYRMALEQIDDEEVAEAKEAGEEKAESSDEESFGGGEEISDSESKDDDSAESKEDAEGGSEVPPFVLTIFHIADDLTNGTRTNTKLFTKKISYVLR